MDFIFILIVRGASVTSEVYFSLAASPCFNYYAPKDLPRGVLASSLRDAWTGAEVMSVELNVFVVHRHAVTLDPKENARVGKYELVFRGKSSGKDVRGY